MQKKAAHKSKNIKDTAKIAKILLDKIIKDAAKAKKATVVGLSGELGAGKTAFTQAVAKHLRIRQKTASPTFVIMKKYDLKSRSYKYFFHIDAYRLKNEKELRNLGWKKIINDKSHLVFIEWPENVSRALPADSRFIYITSDKNGQRSLKLI